MALRYESKKFIETGNKYIDCKRQMDELYDKLDEYHRIAKFPVQTDSNGIESEGGDLLEFKAEYQQQSIDGQPVKNLKQLYEAAELALPHFRSTIQDLVNHVCTACKCDENSIITYLPSLKGMPRAQAKADDDYADRRPGPGVSWLYDIVRGSILFSDAEQIAACLEFMHSNPSIHIVTAKNRFSKPTLTGYRDLKFCFRIACPEGFQHICEIQIHHKDIKKLDSELGSHSYYEFFRKFFAGATDSLSERLEDLKLICAGGSWSELMEQTAKQDEDRLLRLGKLFDDYLCEFDLALRVYRKLVHLRRDKYGEEHEFVADAHFAMGSVLVKKDTIKDAMVSFAIALQIYKKTIGDHIKVANTYETMANVQADNQRKKQVRLSYLGKAVEIKKKLLDESDPSLAKTYQHMALLQSDSQEALDLIQKALDIYLSAFGEQHLSVAKVYEEMAKLYTQLAQVDQCTVCKEKASKIRRIYEESMRDGNFSSDTQAYAAEIASKLFDEEKYDESLVCYQKLVEATKKNLGEEHFSLIDTYKNIAQLLKIQGDNRGSLDFEHRAWNLKRKTQSTNGLSLYDSEYMYLITLARQHGDAEKNAELYNDIADMLMERGTFHDALRFYRIMFDYQIEARGEETQTMVRSYKNIEHLLAQHGGSNGAITNLEKTMNIQTRTEHYHVVERMGRLLCKQNKFNHATVLYQQLLGLQIRVYGKTHVSVGTTYVWMGNLCKERKNIASGILLYEKALVIFENELGNSNSLVADTYHRMGRLLSENSNIEDSIIHYNNAWEIYRMLPFEERHMPIANVYEDMAETLELRGKAKEALMFVERSYEIRKAVGHHDVAFANVMIWVCFLLLREGCIGKAVTVFQQGINLHEGAVGKNHVTVGEKYHTMGIYLQKHGSFHMAREMLETASSKYKNAKLYEKYVSVCVDIEKERAGRRYGLFACLNALYHLHPFRCGYGCSICYVKSYIEEEVEINEDDTQLVKPGDEVGRPNDLLDTTKNLRDLNTFLSDTLVGIHANDHEQRGRVLEALSFVREELGRLDAARIIDEYHLQRQGESTVHSASKESMMQEIDLEKNESGSLGAYKDAKPTELRSTEAQVEPVISGIVWNEPQPVIGTIPEPTNMRRDEPSSTVEELENQLNFYIEAFGKDHPEVRRLWKALQAERKEGTSSNSSVSSISEDTRDLEQKCKRSDEELISTLEDLENQLGFYIEAFGRNHPEVGETYSELSKVLEEMGRYEESKNMRLLANNIAETVNSIL